MSFKRFHTAAALFAVLVILLTGTAAAYFSEDVVGTLNEQLYATTGNTLETLRNASTQESDLGLATADAVREYTGADVVILNGGDMWSNLPSGDITWAEIQKAYTVDREISTTTVTPKQLYELLEECAECIVVNYDTESIDVDATYNDVFPQISGFTVRVDCNGLVGERVSRLKIGDVTLDKEDETTMLTLAATTYFLDGNYGTASFESIPAGVTLAEAFAAYIAGGAETDFTSYTFSGRYKVIGSADDTIYSKIPGGIVMLVIVLIVVIELVRRHKPYDPEDRSVWDRR